MKAIAYYRASTKAQCDLGLESQKAAVREFARQQKVEIVAEIVQSESQAEGDEGDGFNRPDSTA